MVYPMEQAVLGQAYDQLSREPLTMPAVSVILPTFNRTKYLRLAIESVYAQTLTDWELIIVDDGSAEVTASYLRSITDTRVRTIWLSHSGNPSRLKNAGIEVAKVDVTWRSSIQMMSGLR